MALINALWCIPESLHETLVQEFLNELITRGRIHGYRYRPPGTIKAKPVDGYKGRTTTLSMQNHQTKPVCIQGTTIDSGYCLNLKHAKHLLRRQSAPRASRC